MIQVWPGPILECQDKGRNTCVKEILLWRLSPFYSTYLNVEVAEDKRLDHEADGDLEVNEWNHTRTLGRGEVGAESDCACNGEKMKIKYWRLSLGQLLGSYTDPIFTASANGTEVWTGDLLSFIRAVLLSFIPARLYQKGQNDHLPLIT